RTYPQVFHFSPDAIGGDEQRAVVNVGRGGVAGEEDEIGVAVALGVDVHAVADAFVEVQFDHAAGLVNASQRGFGGGQVGGVLRAFDAEQAAQRDGVGRVRLDARGQGAGVFVGVGAAGVFGGDGLGGDGRGAVHAGD